METDTTLPSRETKLPLEQIRELELMMANLHVEDVSSEVGVLDSAVEDPTASHSQLMAANMGLSNLELRELK